MVKPGFCAKISSQISDPQITTVQVLGQVVKLAGIRNGNVALFSKIRHCAEATLAEQLLLLFFENLLKVYLPIVKLYRLDSTIFSFLVD